MGVYPVDRLSRVVGAGGHHADRDAGSGLPAQADVVPEQSGVGSASALVDFTLESV